jgi:hypothetical protein
MGGLKLCRRRFITDLLVLVIDNDMRVFVMAARRLFKRLTSVGSWLGDTVGSIEGAAVGVCTDKPMYERGFTTARHDHHDWMIKLYDCVTITITITITIIIIIIIIIITTIIIVIITTIIITTSSSTTTVIIIIHGNGLAPLSAFPSVPASVVRSAIPSAWTSAIPWVPAKKPRRVSRAVRMVIGGLYSV